MTHCRAFCCGKSKLSIGHRRALLETRLSVHLCCLFLTIQAPLIEGAKIAHTLNRPLCQSPKWWQWLARCQLSSRINLWGGLLTEWKQGYTSYKKPRNPAFGGVFLFLIPCHRPVFAGSLADPFFRSNASKGSLSISSLIFLREQCSLIPVCGFDTNHVVRMVVTEFPIHVPISDLFSANLKSEEDVSADWIQATMSKVVPELLL